MSYIYSYKGNKVFPLNPKIKDLDIETVAHALSNKCRFSGLTSWYSVAEHSVRMTEYFHDRKTALTILLHEIDEVFLCDYAGPIKDHIYYKINNEFISHEIISEKYFKLCVDKFGTIFPLTQEIKYLDLVFCKTEMKQFFGKHLADKAIKNYPILDIYFELWDPQYAKYKFLKRFKELM